MEPSYKTGGWGYGGGQAGGKLKGAFPKPDKLDNSILASKRVEVDK